MYKDSEQAMGREKYNLSESWRRLDWERAQITEEKRRLEIQWEQLEEEKRRMAWERSQFEEEKTGMIMKMNTRSGSSDENRRVHGYREIRSLKRRVFRHQKEDDERKRKERKAKDAEER